MVLLYIDSQMFDVYHLTYHLKEDKSIFHTHKTCLFSTIMSPVSPVFHIVVTLSIGLKIVPRVRASIL